MEVAIIDLSALAFLPCGCIADLQVMQPEQGIATCPWCDAMFDSLEFAHWHMEQPIPLVVSQPPLVLDGERALEVVGECGCRSPLIRERKCGAKPFCCDKPLEILRD